MILYLLLIQLSTSIMKIDVSLDEEKTYMLVLKDKIVLNLNEKKGFYKIIGSGIQINVSYGKSLLENINNWQISNENSNMNSFIYSKNSNDLVSVIIINKDPFNKTIKVISGIHIITIPSLNDKNYKNDETIESGYTKISDTSRGKKKKLTNTIVIAVSAILCGAFVIAIIVVMSVIIHANPEIYSCGYKRNNMSSSKEEGIEDQEEKIDNNDAPDVEQVEEHIDEKNETTTIDQNETHINGQAEENIDENNETTNIEQNETHIVEQVEATDEK